MKKIILTLLTAIVLFGACKKDETSCFQADVTLTYDTYSQYDSTYTTSKMCLTQTQWETLTFEGSFDPITGQSTPLNEVGTRTSRYYVSDRNDSVTKVTKTYEVAE